MKLIAFQNLKSSELSGYEISNAENLLQLTNINAYNENEDVEMITDLEETNIEDELEILTGSENSAIRDLKQCSLLDLLHID